MPVGLSSLVWRRPFVATLVVLALALSMGPAAGVEPAELRIREVQADSDGSVQLIVSVAGDAVGRTLNADDFALTEQQTAVDPIEVLPLLESGAEPVAVALLIDVSGSTEGDPLASAQAAARSFIDDLTSKGVQVSLISFGPAATVLSGFTTDAGQLKNAVNGLVADGETALYDAILAGTSALLTVDAQRQMVLFSDGGDTASAASLDEAVSAAADLDAPISAVALSTPEQDQGALDALAAGTGGRSLSVADAEGLAAAFSQVAEEIASQYVISYSASYVQAEELQIAVSVEIGGVSLTDSIVVINPREAPEAPPEPTIVAAPSGLGGTLGLIVGILAAFAGAVLLFSALSFNPTDRRASRALRRAIQEKQPQVIGKESSSLTSTSLGKAALSAVSAVPKPAGYEERIQKELDQAGWPLRSSEFLVIQLGITLAMIPVGFAVTGQWWFGLVIAPLAFVLVRVVLTGRIRRREAAFLEQLPDTLQVLAAALRAGYALPQACDTVVKESSPPTSEEFARALAEHRLGLPLNEALYRIADRVGGEDFRWVAMAIAIQREVGGDLASLLETVAETMRHRERLKRTVRALSAEGRLSAVILVAVPFVLTAYLALVSPGFLAPLFEETIGLVLIAVASILMVIGIFWLRKIIQIDI